MINACYFLVIFGCDGDAGFVVVVVFLPGSSRR